MRKKLFSLIIFLSIVVVLKSDAVFAFSEQRKFIGQEYDVDTGLNYLNARYYNSNIGRFVSQDPMFWNFDQAWLADPQNQNAYAYARNNPIVGSDPSGLAVVKIGGTNFWGGGTELNNPTLNKNITNSFPDQKVFSFKWDGADNTRTRTEGANQLNSFINDQFKSLPVNEPLNIVCHSHGCNTAAAYTNLDGARQINNLVSLGQPVRGEYKDNSDKINNHINVYSNKDWVQLFAGGQIKSSAMVGQLLLGIPGLLVGKKLGWGEFGLAGREVKSANHNLNVTDISQGNMISSHLDLYRNQSIWDRISKNIK